MSLPDFVLKNLRWKAGALILAVFVWFLIQLAISEGFRPSENLLADFQEETFLEQSVHVLTAPTDTHRFKVTPDRVLVTIRANASVLKKLTADDIRAFVDLVDSTNAVTVGRAVRVHTPEGVARSSIKVKPDAVIVEILDSPP